MDTAANTVTGQTPATVTILSAEERMCIRDGCSRVFTTQQGRNYCSVTCYENRSTSLPVLTIAKGVCQVCESQTISKSAGKYPPAYCSRPCRKIASAHRKRSVPQATCKNCDVVFARDYHDSLAFCSTDCRKFFLRKVEVETGSRGKKNCENFRGKVRYSSIFRAYEAASIIGDPALVAYPCFDCGAYHIGHQRGYELEAIPRPQSFALYSVGRKMMKKIRNSEISGFGLRAR